MKAILGENASSLSYLNIPHTSDCDDDNHSRGDLYRERQLHVIVVVRVGEKVKICNPKRGHMKANSFATIFRHS